MSEWTVDEIRAGAKLAAGLGIQLSSNQPQCNMLWRVIEQEVVPVSEELGLGQICWSPMAQGVLAGKYMPGRSGPSASRFTEEDGKLKTEHKFMSHDVLTCAQQLKPLAEEACLSMAALAVAWVCCKTPTCPQPSSELRALSSW